MNSFTTTAGELIVGEYILTPYQYDKSRYLPIHQDGDYFMVLTVKAE